MAKTNKVLVAGRDLVTLTDKDYLAQGGEGIVYRVGDIAYKLYHNPKSMIPEQKIQELRVLNMPNVLGPRDILNDPKTKQAIGFTMPFISDTEYLCRLFVKNFKQSNGITPEIVVSLVRAMQETLQSVHDKQIIVADYNEMNFLVSKDWKTPYHIDVDSYQTKSFRATAIMESVWDRSRPRGEFDELSDWFSWAIVSFQLYTGIHPFKGKHPAYGTNELDKRMRDNVSVFNPDVRMPKALQDFSVIPSAHLDWYKNVFENGHRGLPPYVADGNLHIIQVTASVHSGGGLLVNIVMQFPNDVLSVNYYNGDRYTLTEREIYKGDAKIFEFTKSAKNVRLANVLGYEPVISVMHDGFVGFFDLNKSEIGKVSADDYMVSDGIIYTVKNGELWENHMEVLGKTKIMPKKVSGVVENSYKMFDGVVIQDVYGSTTLTIPYMHGRCANLKCPELDGIRAIDSKRIGRYMAVIFERGGIINRSVLKFDEQFTTYEIYNEPNVGYQEVNFMVKQNGLMVSVIDQDTLEMLHGVKPEHRKRITDAPIELTMPMYDGITRVLFVNGNKLYEVKS